VTLRSPTSFPLLDERAVDRFMKLIQARRRMAAAAMENMVSVERLPWAWLSVSKAKFDFK